MGVGSLVNDDLAIVDDSQGTLFDVVDFCRFSSPFESAFGKERAIELGFSESQLQRCETRHQDLSAGPRLVPKVHKFMRNLTMLRREEAHDKPPSLHICIYATYHCSEVHGRKSLLLSRDRSS